MAGTNLNSVLSTIQGVSTLWIMEHANHPSTVASPKLLEGLVLPSVTAGVVSGDFDCVGKFAEGTFSQEGDDITVEDKKYTDGSVALTTIKQGTYGMKGELHNVNEAVCKKVLKMTEIAAVAGSTGKIEENKMLAYGATSGSISEAVVYIEFDKSNAYKGMLIPKSSIASKFLMKGDSTDNMTIESRFNFSEAPVEINKAGETGAVSFTTAYAGKTWLLIAK